MTIKIKKLVNIMLIYSVFNALYSSAQTPSETDQNQLETIQIRGFHDSAIKSLRDKRDSQSIIEAISAQDIGKFPDKNVAEALQRITGISLSRAQGEGERVGVRGTTPEQNRTFLNGQAIASADWWISTQPNRGFNYTLLPADLVSSLEVYKTPQADHNEGSLGGSVNIKTQRPLHTQSNQFVTNAQVQYNDLSGEFDPQLAVFYNWTNPDKDIGALITFTRNQRSLRRDGLESWGWHEQNFQRNADGSLSATDSDTADLKNIWTPGGGGSAIFQQQRVLTSATANFEYQPNLDWNIQLNTLYSVLNADNSNQNFLWQPSSVFARGGHASDAKIIDNTLAFARYSKVPEQNLPFSTAMEAIWRESEINTSSVHLIVSQQAHLWQNQYQIGFTKGGGGSKQDHTSQFSANTAYTVDTTGGKNIIANYDVSPLDGQAWQLTEARNDSQDSNDQEFYLQGDFERAIDHSIISAIKVGAKYRDHQRDFIRYRSFNGAFDGIAQQLDWTLANYPAAFPSGFLSEIGDQHTLKNYSYVDINALSTDFKTIDFIQQEEKASRFDIQERTTAGYVKLMLDGNDYRANLGVRVVNTEQDAGAYQRVGSPIEQQESFVWQQHSKNYVDILPSANISFDLSEDLIARVSAARVMSRPQYNHLMPSTNYNVTQAQGQGGNPDLDPYRANQFDLSVEWYFDDAALLSVALFNKDVESFVEFKRTIEQHEGIDMTIDRPINGSGGTIRGVEIGYQQELIYGFGLITNYTFVDGDRTDSISGRENYVPGTSKHTINLTSYYENDWLSSRLAYNYRTHFATGVGETMMDDFGQLDGSITFKLSDKLDFVVEAINLTDEITYLYERNEYAPTGIYQNGRRFYVGVRYSH
ncbi:MAG: TonB-dependent receptor [Pseudoalteromonas prydzensis]|uniref:TonB-dependent receptor n=1 Tax=Pseudoalteromonas prydzensis TaxID=182141 RepID=UPI003F958DBC